MEIVLFVISKKHLIKQYILIFSYHYIFLKTYILGITCKRVNSSLNFVGKKIMEF